MFSMTNFEMEEFAQQLFQIKGTQQNSLKQISTDSLLPMKLFNVPSNLGKQGVPAVRGILQEIRLNPQSNLHQYSHDNVPFTVKCYHFMSAYNTLKHTAKTNDLDLDELCKESEEVEKSLPSVRSLRAMRRVPAAWSELYEDEAWIVPQNDLLDKKFHWWKCIDSWWKDLSSHYKVPFRADKTYFEELLYSPAASPPCKTNSPSVLPSSGNLSMNNHPVFHRHVEITDDVCSSFSSSIFGKSVLGARRAAINQWIIDVAMKFSFHGSTYSLCMQLLDCYLEIKNASSYPVDVENSQELMVVCVASLLLAAAIREHWYNLESDAYLQIIISSANYKFTYDDVILAEADILNTVHPRLLSSYFMFDYCLLYLAELRDVKIHGFLSSDLFIYLKFSGLLFWLYELLQNANKLIIEECVNLRVPGSRLAACLLLLIFCDFCGRDIESDKNWCRQFSHYVLHMHFDSDILFWWTLLQSTLKNVFEEIRKSHPFLKKLFKFWKTAGAEWRNLQIFSETNKASYDLNVNNSVASSTPDENFQNACTTRVRGMKRSRSSLSTQSAVESPIKHQKLSYAKVVY